MRYLFVLLLLALILRPAAATDPTPERTLGEVPVEETCVPCHMGVTKKMYASFHGEARVSCLSCHSYAIEEIPAGEMQAFMFFEPVRSETCARCHHKQYEDWKKGLHLTPWKMFRSRLSRLLLRRQIQTMATGAGEKARNPCLNCHHPHGD
jgi:hypothetical protein